MTTDVQILFNGPLHGGPFSGLVIRGMFGFCAYLGVPVDHWLADLETLEFPCHHDITFRGRGDGEVRPSGYFWYGWDYSHYGDAVDLPSEITADMPEHLRNFFTAGKRWTLDEVTLDMIDAAVHLKGALDSAENLAQQMRSTFTDGPR